MAKPAFSSSATSRVSIRRRMVVLLAFALVGGSIAYPAPLNFVIGKINGVFGSHLPTINKSFVLGLDLQGGTRLEYQADVSRIDPAERASALDGVRDVIERRVNTLGVSEPVIQTAQAGDQYRVSVELAGIRDINQAIQLIGETPILEFKEQSTEPPRALTEEEKKKMEADNAVIQKKAEDLLAAALKNPSDFAALAASSTKGDPMQASSGDLGFLKDKPEYGALFDALKGDASSRVHSSLIDIDVAQVVAKVEEVKSAGTEVNVHHLLISFAGATDSQSTSTKDQARAEIDAIKKQATTKNFTELVKKYSDEPGASEGGGDLGWFGRGVMTQAFEDAAFAVGRGQISDIVETQFGFHLIYKLDERPLNDVRVHAAFFRKVVESDIVPQDGWKNTELTGSHLERAQLDFEPRTGSPVVSLIFDSEGTKLFGEITKRNVGRPIAIFLDGNLLSQPIVQTEITTGQAVISGSATVPEAKALAQSMNAGALPVPVMLIAQQSVGPTLGQDSVTASLVAGMWGFLFVAILMLTLYRLPGVFAVVTLGFYVALSLSIFKLLPVTLTLSGIAGFILSIGIAVDANVLVFERLKEELRDGKSLKAALEEAFKRAWTSIRDGNVTTLISCAVLYWFSSSVIKGFALTLAIGVGLSMLSAIIANRTMLRWIAGFRAVESRPWLFGRIKPEDSVPPSTV